MTLAAAYPYMLALALVYVGYLTVRGLAAWLAQR